MKVVLFVCFAVFVVLKCRAGTTEDSSGIEKPQRQHHGKHKNQDDIDSEEAGIRRETYKQVRQKSDRRRESSNGFQVKKRSDRRKNKYEEGESREECRRSRKNLQESRRGSNNRPRYEKEEEEDEDEVVQHGGFSKTAQKSSNRFPVCPRWNDTTFESKCLWPGPDFFLDIPAECNPVVALKSMPPDVIVEYYKDKVVEFQDRTAAMFKQRGVVKPCGKCSFKVACRQRIKSFKRAAKNICRPIDVQFNNEDCHAPEVCQVTMVNGGCPVPIPRPQLPSLDHPMIRESAKGVLARLWPRRYIDGALSANENRDQYEDGEEIDQNISGGEASDEDNSSNHYSPYLPHWHCEKNPVDGHSCLCCCGDYFPDGKTHECVRVKRGNKYPPIDIN